MLESQSGGRQPGESLRNRSTLNYGAEASTDACIDLATQQGAAQGLAEAVAEFAGGLAGPRYELFLALGDCDCQGLV